MWDKLRSYFNGRGFHPVDLRVEGMALYYCEEEKAAELVWIINEACLASLTAEKYRDYGEKIKKIYLQRGFAFVNLLTLFLTSKPEKAKVLSEDIPFWIVDETYGRLVIFENQPEDYLGLRRMIETNLAFGGESRNSEGAQRRAEYSAAGGADSRRNGAAGAGHAASDYTPKRRGRYGTPYGQRNSLRVSFRQLLAEHSVCVYALVVINAIVFVFTDLFVNLLDTWRWVDAGANSWMSVLEDGEYYRVVTSMFLHGDISHIVNNMLILCCVGILLERKIGHLRFAVLYFLAGIVASFTSIFYHYRLGSPVSSIGASGAIYGVVGAMILYIALHREMVRQINPARIVLAVLLMFYSLFGPSQGIDNAAHLGGLFAGAAIYYAYYLWDMRGRYRRSRNRLG